MDIITKWAKEQMENPEIILNVIEADKIEAKIRMKRKTLIETTEKLVELIKLQTTKIK